MKVSLGALVVGVRRRVDRLRSRAVVREGRSAIDGVGLFVQRAVAAGEVIGQLRLGPPGPQGKHTLLVGDQHRSVEKPWRFLNHSCAPSAFLRIAPPDVTLIAAADLAANSELSIDYGALPEKVSVAFACHCPFCDRGREPARIGGASDTAHAPSA